MLKRNVSILSFAVLSAVVLMGFQNCGQTELNSQTAADPELRIIEDWNKVEIQFADRSIQVHDEATSTGISGLCNRSHNGAQVRWALWTDEKSNRPLLQGMGRCAAGQFSVEIDQLDNVVCGIAHRLVVEGDWGAMATTQFEKRCQPLASEGVAAPDSSPAGTDCSLEYVPSGGAASSCNKVCYRDNKVVLNVMVDAQNCSGLIQKLASP